MPTRRCRRISRCAPTSCTTRMMLPDAILPTASAGAGSSRRPARLSDSVKITLDYYRYRNDATPDWGVPVRDIDNVPITERGIPRNTWVGMKGLDFFKERADIVTGTVVVKLMPGVTLTNRSRAGESELDYVATSMEGIPDVHHPNRDQTARIYANQTELNVKFNTGTFHHDYCCRRGGHVARRSIRFGYNVTNNFDTLRGPSLPIHTSRLTRSSARARFTTRRSTRSDLPYRYGPPVQAMDRQRRHPARRLQSRPGRRAGNQCAGLCGGKHRHCHEHGKRSGQPPQLECRPCLQADPDLKLLCRLRDGTKPDWKRARFHRCAIQRHQRHARQRAPARGAQHRGGHQVGTVRQALACDSGIVPDRRRSRAHQ